MTQHPTEDLLRHADWLGRLARALCRSQADADDAVQEALERARRSGAGPHGATEPWLARILRNVVRDGARSESARRRRERDVARGEAQRSAADDVALLERQRILLRHVEELPDGQRRVVIARYFDGRPPREIAREEGIATSAVHSRLRRALATLRARLDAEFGDRATWLAWIGPVAALGNGARGASRVWGAAAAVLVALGTVTFLALRGGAAPGTPSAAQLEASGRAEAPTGADVELAPPTVVRGTRDRAISASPTPPPTVLVVDTENGAPVAEADVLVVTPQDLPQIDPDDDEAWERHLLEAGDRARTDGEGGAAIPVAGDALVFAWTSTHSGMARAAGATLPLRVELVPNGSFGVTVVDPEGERVAGDVPIRVDVVAGDVNRPDGFDSSSFDIRRTVTDGHSRFTNPLAGMRFSDPAQGERITVTQVSLDIPGAPEHRPDAASRLALPLLPVRLVTFSPDVELVRPSAIGSMELRVHDVDGTPIAGEVQATLEFPHAKRSYGGYTAQVRDGVALWPEVLAGGHAARIRVRIPASSQSWELDATTPERAGTTRRLSTRRPASRTIRARFLDEDGEPHAKCSVELHFESNREAGFVPQLYGQTDASGVVEFVPNEEQRAGRAIGVAVMKHGFFGTRGGFALLDRERGDLAAGGDLGTYRIALEKERRIEGRVLEPSGAPLEGAWVSATLEGRAHTTSTKTNRNGEFVLTALFGETTEIEADDNHGRFVNASIEVRPSELDGPLELQLGATARLVARLDASGLGRTDVLDQASRPGSEGRLGDMYETALRVQLVPVAPRGAGQWETAEIEAFPASEGLELDFDAVAPGTYEARLTIGFAKPFLRIPVTVEASDAGGTKRLEELDGLRLADHLRWVRVSGTLDGAEAGVHTHVVRDDGEALVDAGTELFLEPIGARASATFTATGARAITFPNGLPPEREHLELEFERAETVTVRFTGLGKALQGYRASAEVEGGPNVRLEVAIGPVDRDARVEFPCAGTYRLYLEEPPEPTTPGSGTMAYTRPEPTDVLFEIAEHTTEIEITLPPQ